MADRYWRVPPSLWLWRPAQLDPDSTLRFDLPEGWSESVPWTPIAGVAHSYRLGATPDHWPAQTAFGRFVERTLTRSQKIEDNDLPVIAQKYREFLMEHDR